MAGKKKKSLATKLAKMSDDERARYLQHRADVEEEAKRRKEQLIATFMKKKIKKEEAFSRLNLAKINQNWHQILRKAKCQEMRENVEHLKVYMERLIEYKNKTIEKLLRQLEEAEEEYLLNFKSHSTHIDDILEHQKQYVEKLNKEYEDDVDELLLCAEREKKMIAENVDAEEEYLKTILYGQEDRGKATLRKEYEDYMMKCFEEECNFQSKMEILMQIRQDVCGAIWKQIAATVEGYVTLTDSRRSHQAELKRLDAESAVEIAENEERIRKEELDIEYMKEDYASLQSTQENKLIFFELEADIINKHFLNVRKNLKIDLQLDDSKIRLLTDEAGKSLDFLGNLVKRGRHILNLCHVCKKFETDREKVIKWVPISSDYLCDRDESPPNLGSGDHRKIVSRFSADGLRVQGVRSPDNPERKRLPKSAPPKPKSRLKSSFPRKILSPQSTSVDTPTPEPKSVTIIHDVVCQAKPSMESIPTSPSPPPPSSESSSLEEGEEEKQPKSVTERCFDSLKKLEGFWFGFNKVHMDFSEIKAEKKSLERENKQLRGMIRAVLEAAALSKSLPGSGVSTRLPSRRRTSYSAPLRRVIFQ